MTVFILALDGSMKKFLSLSQVAAIVGSIAVVVLVSTYITPLKAAVGTK